MDAVPPGDDSRHGDRDEETEEQGAGHVALLPRQHLPLGSSASTSASASTDGGTVASRVKDIRAIIDAYHRSDKTNLRLGKSGGRLSLSQPSDASSSSSSSLQSQSSYRKRAAGPGAAAPVQGQSDARLVALLRTAADLATAAAADDALCPSSGAPPAAVPSLAGLVQAVLAALPGRSSTEGGGGRSATSRRVLVYTTALDLLLATTPTPTNPTSGAGGDEEGGEDRDDGEGGLPDQLCREVVEVLVAHLDEFPTTHIVKIVERCLGALRTVERHHQQGGSSSSSSSSSSTVSLRLECLSLIPKCLESLVGVTPVDPKGLCG